MVKSECASESPPPVRPSRSHRYHHRYHHHHHRYNLSAHTTRSSSRLGSLFAIDLRWTVASEKEGGRADDVGYDSTDDHCYVVGDGSDSVIGGFMTIVVIERAMVAIRTVRMSGWMSK